MPPRHHPYSGYDAAGGPSHDSGHRRGGATGREGRGRGGGHYGQGSNFRYDAASSNDGDAYSQQQIPPPSSAVPLRLGFGTPVRPSPPPPPPSHPGSGGSHVNFDPSFPRPPIHLGSAMRPPPPPTPSSHHNPPPQSPRSQSGLPPPPPQHQQMSATNDWGTRKSLSHDPYAPPPSDHDAYTQPPGQGFSLSQPPPPLAAAPYGAYSQQSPLNAYGVADRDPSYGPDRSHASTDRRVGAEPYNRNGPPTRQRTSAPLQDQDPRTKDERPCRTLFIRNVANTTSPEAIQNHFLQFGEIKTFFDVIAKKGICFISYYDMRGAEWAKKTTHQQKFYGRNLDVHFSLPKDQDTSKRCDRDQNQGTLFMLLKRLARTLSDDEFAAIYSKFGEVKSIRRYKDQKNARFLEFYDSRACIAAHDAMGKTLYTDPSSGSVGEWDVKFAWDAQQIGKGKAKGGSTRDGSSSGWSPPPQPYQQGPPSSMPPPQMGIQSHPLLSGPPSGPPPSQSYGYNNGAPSTDRAPPLSTSPAPPSIQQQQHQGTGQGPAQWGSMGRPPPPPSSGSRGPGGVAASAAGGAGDDAHARLEQAQKVQQLLASLSGGDNSVGDQGAQPPPANVNANGGGRPGGEQNLPPNLAQLLAGVAGSNPSGVSQQQQQAIDPRRNGGVQGLGGGAGAGSNSSAAEAQESIQRMLAMLGQGGGK